MSKESLINEIILQCKVSNVAHDKHIPLDKVFMSLVGLDEVQLKKIASELYIKVE